jgi:hypothetical protein
MPKKKSSQQKSRKIQKEKQNRIQKGGQTRKRTREPTADTPFKRRSVQLSKKKDANKETSPIEYVPPTDIVSIMFPENQMLQKKLMNFKSDD